MIKCEENADEIMNEIKTKIKLSKIGATITSLCRSKSNNKLRILKTKNKDQTNILVEKIKKLKLSTTAEISTKFQPTIIIFGVYTTEVTK